MHIEKEYKMMLTKQQYDLLLQNLPFKEKKTQVNHYYMSQETKKGARIREVSNQFIFTYKLKSPIGQKEYEVIVSKNWIKDPAIDALCLEIGIENDFEAIGNMTTIRHLLPLEHGEICLDENHYLDTIDYEIEYELYNYLKDDVHHFIQQLEKLGIIFIENKVSKFKRYKNKKQD